MLVLYSWKMCSNSWDLIFNALAFDFPVQHEPKICNRIFCIDMGIVVVWISWCRILVGKLIRFCFTLCHFLFLIFHNYCFSFPCNFSFGINDITQLQMLFCEVCNLFNIRWGLMLTSKYSYFIAFLLSLLSHKQCKWTE